MHITKVCIYWLYLSDYLEIYLDFFQNKQIFRFYLFKVSIITFKKFRINLYKFF